MKACELMIGDWEVTKKAKDLPMRIEYFEKKYIYGRTSDNVIIGPFLEEEIFPIRLTEEILAKNGYEPWRITDERICWRKNPDYVAQCLHFDTVIIDGDLYLCYVHELQHALRLCGIEKEIVL